MKKFSPVFLAFVVISGLILVSCAGTSTAPPPASTSAPATTQASTATTPATTSSAAPATTATGQKVYTIRFSCYNPQNSWSTQKFYEPYWNEVEKRSNGRIKVERYYGQTLVKMADEWEAVKNGTADVSLMSLPAWQGLNPLGDVMMLPFIPAENAKEGARVFMELYNKYPDMQAGYKDNKVINLGVVGPYFFITTNKQIKTMADISGLKLRATGAPTLDALQRLGAVPIWFTMADCYQNMQKGVIDGALMLWEAMYSFKMYEPIKYLTYLPGATFYFAGSAIAFNWNTWNSLPSDLQGIIMDVFWNGSVESYGLWCDNAEQPTRDMMKADGKSLIEYTLPQAEFDKMVQTGGKPVWDKWVADNQAKYPEAQNILNDMLSMCQQYKGLYK